MSTGKFDKETSKILGFTLHVHAYEVCANIMEYAYFTP